MYDNKEMQRIIRYKQRKTLASQDEPWPRKTSKEHKIYT